MPKIKQVVKQETYVDRERQEIEDLEKRIKQIAPAPGQLLTAKAEGEDAKFSQLPLSKLTLKGLARGKYETLTEIQRQAIPHALAGRDILGAAKTGSGKTIAFLVPLVEDLFRQQWSREDGIGGLVISPTRELALQIYEVLRVLMHYHAFTCGLVVGGTDFEKEQNTALKSQIIVCTPGRIMQHLEQTPSFDVAGTLRTLVLDEADRLLDMGFKEQLEAIIGYLPAPRDEGGSRQTMLFSATQTKSLKDLARLSLRDPEYIAVHVRENQVTPLKLRQLYVICPLGDKIDLVFSFIKSHLKNKTIMFFSSCKQVKFMETAFRRLRPGVPVMALHGKMAHSRRTEIYEDFCSRPAAVLFATDIASRGLDFPNVDWVVQIDCPEDAAAYIHRVGRTARYDKDGNALLVLLPSEEKAFLKLLEQSKVPIKKLGVNPMRKQSIRENLRGLLIADPDLKQAAQRAFKGYLRSVHLETNSDVFDVKQLSFKEFAASLGLASAPRMKFTKQGGEAGRQEARVKKNPNYMLEKIMNDDDDEEDGDDDVKKVKPQKNEIERMLKRQPQSSRVPNKDDEDVEDEEDDEPFLRKKTEESALPAPSKTDKGKKRKVKPIKFISDLDIRGKVMRPKLDILDDEDESDSPPADAQLRGDFMKRVTTRLRNEDIVDRETDRLRVKEQRREIKAKKKKQRIALDDDADDEEMVVTLGNSEDEAEPQEQRKRSKHAPQEDDNADVEQAALRLIAAERE